MPVPCPGLQVLTEHPIGMLILACGTTHTHIYVGIPILMRTFYWHNDCCSYTCNTIPAPKPETFWPPYYFFSYFRFKNKKKKEKRHFPYEDRPNVPTRHKLADLFILVRTFSFHEVISTWYTHTKHKNLSGKTSEKKEKTPRHGFTFEPTKQFNTSHFSKSLPNWDFHFSLPSDGIETVFPFATF